MKKPSARSEITDGRFPAQWQVVLVPFPYSDRLAEKRRPALIVSNTLLREEFDLVWVVMITSAANPRWTCDVEISNLRVAGLPAPSIIRPAKLATIESARIVRRIGTIDQEIQNRVAEYFRRTLGK
jgi:mRNA interferase MazF